MSLTLCDIHLSRGGKHILKGASSKPFSAGEFTVLAGPNGAGKSSLLRAIAQSLPYEGEIAFEGRDIARMRGHERAEFLGYMPQNLQSHSDLTVLEGVIVAMNAGHRTHISTADQIACAESLLARFDISDLAERPLSHLSGGQRQTVGLTQALARDPQLIVLDEPTAALDLAMQFRILKEVKAIAHGGQSGDKAGGRVVIAVLHDLTQAARWADRIIMLHDGQIIADGAPTDVLTPKILQQVYNIHARVEKDSQGHLFIAVDGTR
jgi:iron complex transport system ATP-binding protein